MKKRKNWLFASVMLLVMLVMAGCGDKEDFEAADKVAYEYIAATVEKDDDRKAEILTEEAKEEAINNDLLIEGRHDNKGAEKELNDRYEIRRYDNLYDSGNLYYRVKYDIPNNEGMQSDTEYIKMIKDESGEWKLNLSNGILNDEKAKIFPTDTDKEKGTLVHEYIK